MVTTGQHVPAKAALAMGLFDSIVEEGALRDGAIAFARVVLAEDKPLTRIRDQNAKVEAARGKPGDLQRLPQRRTPASSAASWLRKTTSSASRRR